MSTALAKHVDPERERLELIKNTISPKGELTDHELQLFLYTAKRHGLDPLARQIYAVKRDGKMTIQTGIDGYRAIADRTGKYAGNDDYEFDDPNSEQPIWAKATVYKIVEGVRCNFTATARWKQYCPTDPKSGWAWRKMPHVMLGKCAEALALRKAFPSDLSGLYTTEEMEQANNHTPSRKAFNKVLEETQISEEDYSQETEEETHTNHVETFKGTVDALKAFEKNGETISIATVAGKKITVVEDKMQADFRKWFNEDPKPEVAVTCLEKNSEKIGLYWEARVARCESLVGVLKDSIEHVKKQKAAKQELASPPLTFK